MSLVIEIDTLSLEGLTQMQAARAARVFEAELNALLERHGLPPGAHAEDAAHMDIGSLPDMSRTPDAIGRELASALFNALCRKGRP